MNRSRDKSSPIEALHAENAVRALSDATLKLNQLLDRYWEGDNSKRHIIAMCNAQLECKNALAALTRTADDRTASGTKSAASSSLGEDQYAAPTASAPPSGAMRLSDAADTPTLGEALPDRETIARCMVLHDQNYSIYHMPGDAPRKWQAGSGAIYDTHELSEEYAEKVRKRADEILALFVRARAASGSSR